MNEDKLKEILENHKKWLNNDGGESANLRYANLHGANLHGADLYDADLRGADLDFTCLPLWCGSKNIKVDMKLIYQLLAHVYVLDNDSEDFKEIQKLIRPYAEKSHRWSELKE